MERLFDIIIILLIVFGFTTQGLLILFLTFTNRKYYASLATSVAENSVKTTLLLVGKIDEGTDASAMAISQATRAEKSKSA